MKRNEWEKCGKDEKQNEKEVTKTNLLTHEETESRRKKKRSKKG